MPPLVGSLAQSKEKGGWAWGRSLRPARSPCRALFVWHRVCPRRPPCSRLLLLLARALLPPWRTKDISIVHSRDGLVVLLPRCHSVPSRVLLAVIDFASSEPILRSPYFFHCRNPSLPVITSAKSIRKMDPKPEPLPSDFPPLYSRVFSDDDSTA